MKTEENKEPEMKGPGPKTKQRARLKSKWAKRFEKLNQPKTKERKAKKKRKSKTRKVII